MKKPQLVGIVNLTPDSFSGDGKSGKAALVYAAKQVADGADMLDIGAESTRPGATPVSAEEEWARLGPFLKAAPKQPWRSYTRISVDTRHASTAAKALAAGVDIINDVGGLTDKVMLATLGVSLCDIIVMHSLGVPASAKKVWPKGTDAVAATLEWKAQVLERAHAAGIASERLIFDPGIGFGKTAEQSLALMLGAGTLKASGGQWYFGHSRKSFLKLFGAEETRDALTLAFSAQLVAQGVDYLRVHEVAAHAALLEKLCM